MISTMKWVRNLLLKGSSPQSDLANAEWKALESTLATKCTLPKDNQSIKHIRTKNMLIEKNMINTMNVSILQWLQHIFLLVKSNQQRMTAKSSKRSSKIQPFFMT